MGNFYLSIPSNAEVCMHLELVPQGRPNSDSNFPKFSLSIKLSIIRGRGGDAALINLTVQTAP